MAKRRKKRRKLTRRKARKILRDGKIRGKKLTKKQKRFFGFIVGKKKSTRLRKK